MIPLSSLIAHALMLIVCLAVANFTYEAWFGHQDYTYAFKETFAQAAALAMFIILIRWAP